MNQDQMPQNVEAEKLLLGAILMEGTSPNSGDVLDAAVLELRVEDFYLEKHKRIWAACLNLREPGPVNESVLCAYLVERDQVDGCGGIAYITSLTLETVTTTGTERLVENIKSAAKLRQLVTTSTDIIELSRQSRGYAQTLKGAQAKIQVFLDETTDGATQERIGESIVIEAQRISDYAETGQKGAITAYLPTGLSWWDEALGGLNLERPTVIAARPGHGKTSMSLQLLSSLAFGQEIPVGMLSIEMTRNAVVQRIVCRQCGIPHTDYRAMRLKSEEYQRVYDLADDVYDSPFWVDYASSVNVQRMKVVARQWVRRYQIRALFVDYLQLVEGNTRDSEYVQISQAMKASRQIQKDLKLAVVVLCQLNRECEKRKDRRPIMSDLKGSGSLEQDAGTIVFLHRPSVYMNESDREDASEEELSDAELLVAKGPRVQTIYTTYKEDFGEFVGKGVIERPVERDPGPPPPDEPIYLKVGVDDDDDVGEYYRT